MALTGIDAVVFGVPDMKEAKRPPERRVVRWPRGIRAAGAKRDAAVMMEVRAGRQLAQLGEHGEP